MWVFVFRYFDGKLLELNKLQIIIIKRKLQCIFGISESMRVLWTDFFGYYYLFMLLDIVDHDIEFAYLNAIIDDAREKKIVLKN